MTAPTLVIRAVSAGSASHAADAASALPNGWRQALRDAGAVPIEVAESPDWVPQLGAGAPSSAPAHVLALMSAQALRDALGAHVAPLPCPLTLLGTPPAPALLAELLAQGLNGWWPAELDAASAAAALALDRARWQRECVLHEELQRARGQLDERKWVDRAKGVLMSARGMGEDEAFRLLRGAAMHANLRVGEVSRSVTEAARWAEAINRAGQLRMLSQRLVKLAAQRLAGVDARRSRALQDASAERAMENLLHLASLPALAGPPVDAGLQAVQLSWGRLQQALSVRLSPAVLQHADACADALLAAAEALAAQLEAGGARSALHIVNLCGRQRMRVQRLAKDALLAELLAEPARLDTLTPLMDGFEATLRELEQAPLSSPEIREALVQARDEWLRLLRGLRGPGSAEGRSALARSSEALLDIFDRLTASYERSLQVIMG